MQFFCTTTCDYILYNDFNNKSPITIIFGLVIVSDVVSLCVIERWFHFLPHSIPYNRPYFLLVIVWNQASVFTQWLT